MYEPNTYKDKLAQWAARSIDHRALAAAWIAYHGPSNVWQAPVELRPHIVALLDERTDNQQAETD